VNNESNGGDNDVFLASVVVLMDMEVVIVFVDEQLLLAVAFGFVQVRVVLVILRVAMLMLMPMVMVMIVMVIMIVFVLVRVIVSMVVFVVSSLPMVMIMLVLVPMLAACAVLVLFSLWLFFYYNLRYCLLNRLMVMSMLATSPMLMLLDDWFFLSLNVSTHIFRSFISVVVPMFTAGSMLVIMSLCLVIYSCFLMLMLMFLRSLFFDLSVRMAVLASFSMLMRLRKFHGLVAWSIGVCFRSINSVCEQFSSHFSHCTHFVLVIMGMLLMQAWLVLMVRMMMGVLPLLLRLIAHLPHELHLESLVLAYDLAHRTRALSVLLVLGDRARILLSYPPSAWWRRA
jgi:hypothetical protein